MSIQQQAFDGSELTRPASDSEVRRYIRQLRSEGRYPSSAANAPLGFGVLIGVQAAIGAGLLIAGLVVVAGGPTVTAGMLLGFGVLLLIWAVTNMFKFLRTSKDPSRWIRLERFATAHGMTFLPKVSNPALPGVIFQTGWARASTEVLRRTSVRFAEYANFQYRTGDKNNYIVHRWGYVAVRLDRPLPNIVLDAKSNNGLYGTDLPEAFRSHQRLSLEGDFDQYFTLYCPTGYEADALYLFTPDIMARFIDSVAALDVEIVDDWLLLYAPRDLSTLDPQIWQWLLSVVAALEDKFAQWGRWHDDRADARTASAAAASSSLPADIPSTAEQPVVAPQGQRLKRRR
ncbi:hypothetical protein ET475_09170 [Microbacterium protaetiae]|uniref:DUF3137 domain-containing protein n=1 Tax=Microbacterium protaetiae TaxID=2509458 RepID=A0A4P6EDE3_9MICO|nr:hypothetical protein [Microbacterium protaetiae]QAY60144.1 hypothetical protein ET475_09170 [Microbacterium protaetiae]